MKRRRLSLILICIAGVALFAASWWWSLSAALGWLWSCFANYIPLVRENADFIQAVGEIGDWSIRIISALGSLSSGILFWFTQHPEATSEALQPVTLDDLTKRYGKAFTVQWIDRDETQPIDLQPLPHRVILTGRSRQGKTRESIELIRRAIDAGSVTPDHIYEPTREMQTMSAGQVGARLQTIVNPSINVLLFIDDLPLSFQGEALQTLDVAFRTLEQFQTCYVVATARSEHLTPEHEAWLKDRFRRFSLRDLTSEEIGALALNAALIFGVSLGVDAHRFLVEHSNGTPARPIDVIRFLPGQLSWATLGTVQQTYGKVSSDAWGASRDALMKRTPAAPYLMDALADFHLAGVRSDQRLALTYAAHLWRHADRRLHQHMRALNDALYTLRDEIVQQGERLYFAGVVDAEGVVTDSTERLGVFLCSYRRLFHNRWLRRFSRGAERQRWALFDLAVSRQVTANRIRGASPGKDVLLRSAVNYYTAALAVSPHPYAYNNRGLAYRHLGEYGEAVEDFTRAIERSPDFTDQPTVYFNRGLARSDLKEYGAALEDYTRAIDLYPTPPDRAKAYFNRGLAHRHLDRYEAAVEDYTRAIDLYPIPPDRAKAYFNRGLAHRHLDEYEAAVEDYTRAIDLYPTPPDQANAYFNRGLVWRLLNEHSMAVTDYEQAVRLAPDDQDNTVGWLSALADWARRQDNDAGWQRYLNELRPLLPDDSAYAWACFESLAGNVDRSLELLAQAIAEKPSQRTWARVDPDLAWVRDDPRFSEIVGDSPAGESTTDPE